MIKLMKSLLFILLMQAICLATFSIVAVDPETGEVGSAGGSCIAGSVIISDIHVNRGVIHTQSYYHPTNQNNASNYMNQGYSPQQILDLLVDNDIANNPGLRQYGIVDLDSNNVSASYTGEQCLDWKGQINGSNYAIQGNILLGPEILEQMESNFINTLSSFIRVAKPNDSINNLYLDLNVNSVINHYNQTGQWLDPIDSLQTLYNNWLQSQANAELGDVNLDQIVDVLDIVIVVNFIMGNASPNIEEQYLSDLNQDFVINIQDIILLVNIIVS